MNNKKITVLLGIALAAIVVIVVVGKSFYGDKKIKVGLVGGISGPIASMAPAMVSAAKLAFDHANEQGGFFNDGIKVETVVGDSGCNPQNATDAVTKLINLSKVVGLVGPYCSGATIAAAESVAIPADVALISPSSTAPTVSSLSDKDLVYRTVSSDAYQGVVLARGLRKKGFMTVAVTYLNNDYGKGLATSFKKEFRKIGGRIKAYKGHEGGKASYRSELASLARKGAKTLVIFDYANGSGLTILRQALSNGFFKNYVGADGMKANSLIKTLKAKNLKRFYVSAPVGSKGTSLKMFNKLLKKAGGNPDDVFVTTSYDAGFILALAIEKAGSKDTQAIAKAIRSVASKPGVVIRPGEWRKAKAAIAAGKDVNYEGASGSHEFDKRGDVPGTYSLFKVKRNKLVVDRKLK